MVAPRRGGQSGYALIIALVVLFFVSVALSLIFAALALRLRTAQLETQTIHLVALADAGVAEALAGLAQDAGYTGAATHALGSGTIASRVARLSPQLHRITAQASYGGRERAVEVMAVRDLSGTLRVVAWRRTAPAAGSGASGR